MPRGVYRRRAKHAPATALAVPEEAHVKPTQELTALKWWTELNADEQKTVQTETERLSGVLYSMHNSSLEVGEHLATLQAVLEPHGLFLRYLRNFHFSMKTAYRYIKRWQNNNRLPKPIVEIAAARNLTIGGDTDARPFGAYTEAIKKLPPPVDPTPEQATTWLDQVERVRKEVKQAAADALDADVTSISIDPNLAMEKAYRSIHNLYKQLPDDRRIRANWLNTLVGMLLTDLGVSAPQTFRPQAIPEEFRQGRGRPARVAEMVAS